MEAKDLERFKAWFADYTTPFYGDDDYVNANLKLKQDHTLRVCDEIAALAEELLLTDEQKLIAGAIGLFHDIGRFRQFVEYRTFVDLKSTNHSELSVEVLRENGVLDGVSQRQADIIRAAIRLHNQKVLPSDLDEETAFFARLIRDADKIDIYYVALKNYQEYKSCPEGFVYEVDLSDDASYTPGVLQAVMDNRSVGYHELRTINDVKLLQLGWIFDVNFNQALRIIRQRSYPLKLLAMLPRTPEIAKFGQHVFKYLDGRLEEDQLQA